MMLPPLPWEYHEPARFRLAGFGGAAMFLRCTVVLPVSGDNQPVLGLDIGLLSDVDFVQMLARPTAPGFSQHLSDFFLAAASSQAPEGLEPFVEPISTLRCTVTGGRLDAVELEVEILHDPGEPDGQSSGIGFLTSRAALAQAAFDVRSLEGIQDDELALPSDWR